MTDIFPSDNVANDIDKSVNQEGVASLEALLGNFSSEGETLNIEALEGQVTFSRQEHQYRFGFDVGAFKFLVLEGYYCEMLVDATLSSLPNSLPIFAGLTNVRGDLVPVYNLEALCEFRGGATELEDNRTENTDGDSNSSDTIYLDKRNSDKNYILVLGKADEAVGILVEDVPRSYDMANANLLTGLPELPEGLAGAIKKGYLLDDTCWFEFDHEKFFEAVLKV